MDCRPSRGAQHPLSFATKWTYTLCPSHSRLRRLTRLESFFVPACTCTCLSAHITTDRSQLTTISRHAESHLPKVRNLPICQRGSLLTHIPDIHTVHNPTRVPTTIPSTECPQKSAIIAICECTETETHLQNTGATLLRALGRSFRSVFTDRLLA